MTTPLGFYPFSINFLRTLEVNERKQYLENLENMFLSFLSNQPPYALNSKETEQEWKQRQHKLFLTEIIQFYNQRITNPTKPTKHVFPIDTVIETKNENGFNALLQVSHESSATNKITPPVIITSISNGHSLLSINNIRPTSDDNVESPKKRRKLAHTDEKRLSRYRSSPSKALLERLRDTVVNRFFLVEEIFSDDPKIVDNCIVVRNYRVWDRTGKIYDVHISNLPGCNCPASSKGLNCVHILFIFSKVFKLSQGEPILFQRALLTTELVHVFSNSLSLNFNSICTLCYDPIISNQCTFTCLCNRKYHNQCYQEFKTLPHANTVVCNNCKKPKMTN